MEGREGASEGRRRETINPLPTIGNSLKKQKSLYKVLTPSIKPMHHINLYGLMDMGAHDTYMYICVIGNVGKGLRKGGGR